MMNTRMKMSAIIGISIAAAVLVPIAATAAFQEGPYTYIVDNGQATIIDFDTAYSGDLTIASSLGDYSVTSISDWAFSSCRSLTSVMIPDSVTSIGDSAFSDCTSLTSVYFCGTPPTLGSSVFTSVATLYYLSRNADQWPETYGDHPTARWLPEITKADINAATRNFHMKVFWAPRQNVAIEAATRLVDPDWTTIRAITIPPSGLLEFTDPDAVNHRHRFYRIVAPAPSGMVLIPGGTNTGTDPDSGAYSLTVDTFYMDRYEVTKALWEEVRHWSSTRGYHFSTTAPGKAANHPAHGVSWYDAIKWCNARSEKEGRPAVYTVNGAVYRSGLEDNVVQTTAAGYRLPTDVEWEYAARGGLQSKRFPWGDTIQHARANYWSSSGYTYDISPTRSYHPTYATGGTPYTSPVGSFAANGYGLYDMSGNVLEWVFDWHPDHVGSSRVLRGGSWRPDASHCRVAFRSYIHPNGFAAGIRAVLSLDQEPDPVPTGTVWANVNNAAGTVRLPAGEIYAVLLHRTSDYGEEARVIDPGSNPVEFSNVPYGTYYLQAYCWDMLAAVSSTFRVHSPSQTVVFDSTYKRPLIVTVYHSDGQTPFGGATVTLDSWNGEHGQWTERASDTADAASGSVTFLTWPTTLPGERYRVRILDGEGTQAGVRDYVTLADTDAGSSYSVTISQDPPSAPAPSGMVLIPGGTNNGTNPLAEEEAYDPGLYPATYSLTVDSFYMDRYEVTKALWDEVCHWAVTHGGYSFDNFGRGKAANHPVHTVNWYDVVKWCNARSEKEGRPAVYTVNSAVYRGGRADNVVQTTAAGYRLPTDVEWEYAARGGLQGKRFPWGDTIQHARANYRSYSSYTYDTSPTRGPHSKYNDGVSPYTSPVGSFAANGYGLYDMSGNVWEWVFDWHPTWVGSYRVLRGGGWDNNAGFCRVSSRSGSSPVYAFSYLGFGFRAVLTPGPVGTP